MTSKGRRHSDAFEPQLAPQADKVVHTLDQLISRARCSGTTL